MSVSVTSEKRLLASSHLFSLFNGMYQSASHWTNFHEIWYWGLLQKYLKKLQIWSSSAKNIGHFTWSNKYVYIVFYRIWQARSHKSRKAPINFMSFRLFVCLSLYSFQGGSYRKDFREIWYWGLLRKSFQKLQAWLKLDKNTGHLTGRCKCVSYCWQSHT